MTIDTTRNVLNCTAGISLAGKIFEKIGLHFPNDKTLSNQEKNIIQTMAGQLVQGRTRYAEVDLFRHDTLFKKSLSLEYIYTPETVCLYFERLADTCKDYTLNALNQINLNLLNTVELTPIRTEDFSYIPVDIDVSPMNNSNSKKEGVGRTYKGHDGLAPIFAYIGSEGYMLGNELRPGIQHCQKGTPQFLEKILESLKQLNLKNPVLIRMDSGNDAFENFKLLLESKYHFLIKKNLRRESKLKWLDLAMAVGCCETPRKGKRVYTGVWTGPLPKAKKKDNLPDVDQVFRVTVRESDHNGNFLIFPDLEVEVYWTNIFESPEKVIDLYHDHGTSEQFHSELKTDMDVERFPSGKMGVNSIILQIAMVAFNTLRLIGQKALSFRSYLPYKHKGKRKRLRKVISDLIRVSCKVTRHSNRWKIMLWEHDPWYPVFKKIYQSL